MKAKYFLYSAFLVLLAFSCSIKEFENEKNESSKTIAKGCLEP